LSERTWKFLKLRNFHLPASLRGSIHHYGSDSAKTIDRLLAREKQVRGLRQNRNFGLHPLLYQKVPVKGGFGVGHSGSRQPVTGLCFPLWALGLTYAVGGGHRHRGEAFALALPKFIVFGPE
jgi:hypothetical protein